MGFVTSAILSPLCKRLINTAWQEYELVRDVKEEVGKLRLTVSLIQEVLQDAEQKQVKKEVVRDWLRSLKQLLYDAEDILDEAATDHSALETRRVEHGASRSVNPKFGCGSIDEILSRRDLAHQIKRIRKKLDDICKEKDALGLNALGLQELLITSDENICPAAVNTKRSRPHTSSLLIADKTRIVGRDDEKRKIIQMLMGSELETWTSEPTSSNNDNVHVLSLVGMGGVGKTTLAKLVFSDPTVKQHFHERIWVCVSEHFDVNRITKEILEVLSPDQQKESFKNMMNWDSAQRRLKAKIEGKKFLLVLDDVWVVDHSNWESLCGPLTYGGKGSRIMVTTRNQKVSNMVKASCVPLKSLSDEDLWPILKSYAFDGGSGNVQLVSIGRQMVKKLKGSPLAAKTIGRILNQSLDVRHWKNILDSEIFMLEQDPNDISPVLKLSYDHLPGHLKQCFAYCSLFPKDYKFSRSELAQLWVAQNFIQTPTGDQHFDDLLYMSFFEESTYESKYVMHDLIHDLAESISKDDCLRLGDDFRPNKSPEAIRHVSIANRHLDPMKLEELCRYGKLRTLHFLSQWRFDLSPLLLDNLFMKLKRLRVLGLRHCGISELPTSIGKLKHLRFVDLSYTNIRELPESFCGLHNLQTAQAATWQFQIVQYIHSGAHGGNLQYIQEQRALNINLHVLSKKHLYFVRAHKSNTSTTWNPCPEGVASTDEDQERLNQPYIYIYFCQGINGDCLSSEGIYGLLEELHDRAACQQYQTIYSRSREAIFMHLWLEIFMFVGVDTSRPDMSTLELKDIWLPQLLSEGYLIMSTMNAVFFKWDTIVK